MTSPLAKRFADQRPIYKVPLERFFKLAGIKTDAQARSFRRRQAAETREKALKTYANGTVHFTFTAAREFYKWLLDMEEIEKSPLDGIDIKAKRNVSSWNVLYRGEVDKLLKSCAKDSVLTAVVIGLVDHGFRVSELCSLTWGQVRKDGDRHVVDFKGKGSKDALIILSKRFVQAIGSRAMGACPLIPAPGSIGKGHLTRFQVHAMVTSLCWKVLNRKVTPHGLRAAYVSRLVAEKGLATAQRLARHEDTTTTMRYFRWDVKGEDDETDHR